MAKRHLSIEEKEKLIKEFQNSDDSKEEFCKNDKIGVTAFRSSMNQGKEETKVAFLKTPNHLTQSPKNDSITHKCIQLEVGVVKISLPTDTTSRFLGELIKVVANV